jgi:hypothetical protein
MAGIKTGFNEAFWLDADTRDRLLKQDKRCGKFIKPLLVGDDVRGWRTKPVTTWIIYTPIGTDLAEIGPLREHLKQWKPRLEQRALDQAWYELQQAQQRYCRHFEHPKIVYPDIAKEPRFTFDADGRYIDMTAFALPSNDKSLLGILNSKAVWFFLKRTAAVLGDADKGGRLRLKRQYMEKLPIPAATPAQQASIERVVDYLLWLHRQPEVTAGREPRDPVMLAFWEQVVNALVYELFFPAELAAARIFSFFRLVDEAGLRPLAELPTADGRKTCINDAERLTSLRTTFERLNATSHPLRAALFTLAGLDFVRLIEGRTPPGEAIPEPATPASP